MNREQQINKATNLTKQKVKLLLELKQAERYEKCKYELLIFKEKNCDTMYMLVDIKTKGQLFFGRANKLKSYMNLRSINLKDVFTKRLKK